MTDEIQESPLPETLQSGKIRLRKNVSTLLSATLFIALMRSDSVLDNERRAATHQHLHFG